MEVSYARYPRKQFSTIQARLEVGRCGPSSQFMKMTLQFRNLVAGLVGWVLHVQGYLVDKKMQLQKPDRILPCFFLLLSNRGLTKSRVKSTLWCLIKQTPTGRPSSEDFLLHCTCNRGIPPGAIFNIVVSPGIFGTFLAQQNTSSILLRLNL